MIVDVTGKKCTMMYISYGIVEYLDGAMRFFKITYAPYFSRHCKLSVLVLFNKWIIHYYAACFATDVGFVLPIFQCIYWTKMKVSIVIVRPDVNTK